MKYPQRGRMDVLNARKAYASLDSLGIPEVPVPFGPMPDRFLPWVKRAKSNDTDGLHFFLDDHQFEPVWTSPGRYSSWFENRTVCSPDFSLFVGWPLAACIWNVYRSRWLARRIAELGARVIPAVSWAGPETFSFAFRGIQRGSRVAVSGYNSQAPGYRPGFEAMVSAISPGLIVVVGGALPFPDWMWAQPLVHYRANTLPPAREAA